MCCIKTINLSLKMENALGHVVGLEDPEQKISVSQSP
jgi:hypothetical protein